MRVKMNYDQNLLLFMESELVIFVVVYCLDYCIVFVTATFMVKLKKVT